MKRLFLISLLPATAAALLAAGCTPKKEDKPPTPKVAASAPAAAALPKMGPAPKWQLRDLNGQAVSLEQFKGKVVVLDFWATWCGPCRMEIPGYIEMAKKYGKDGLVIVGVSVDQGGPDVVKPFVAKMGINYQIVMGDEATAGAYGALEAIPTTVIIDRSGQVRHRKVGAEQTSEYEKNVLSVLNEKA